MTVDVEPGSASVAQADATVPPAADSLPGRTGLSRRDWVAIAALGGLGLALCLLNLSSRGINLDEAVSLHVAGRPGLHDVLHHDGGEMVAYYLFLKVWTVLGQSEWVARLPSAIFAAGSAVVLYVLARRLYDRTVALIAGLLLVVNASFVRYGQFARGFTLEMLAIVASWLLLVIALERRRPGWFVAYGLLVALAVAAHPFALFTFAAQGASILLLGPDKVPWRSLAVGMGVAAAAVTPVAVAMARQGSGQIAWINPLSRAEVRSVLLFLGPTSPSVGHAPWVLGIYLLTWVVGIGVAVRTRAHFGRSWQSWSHSVAAVWLLVPLLGAVASSAIIHPLLVPRYFIGVLPAAALLGAAALSRLRGRILIAAATCLIVLAGTVVAGSYHTAESGWRQATTYLSSSTQPGDAVVFSPPWARGPVEYYWALHRPSQFPDPLSPQTAWGKGLAYAYYRGPSPPAVAAAASSRPRVWLVVYSLISGNVWVDRAGRLHSKDQSGWNLAAFVRRLPPGFRVGAERRLPNVRVFLLEPRS